jgi:hypothetical protein
MAQHTQLIKCNIIYQKKQNQKINDPLNRHKKTLEKNSTSFHDKISDETRNRRNVPQHNKHYI